MPTVDEWRPGFINKTSQGLSEENAKLRRQLKEREDEIAAAHSCLDEALDQVGKERLPSQSLVDRIGEIEVEDGLTIAVLMAHNRQLMADNERLMAEVERLCQEGIGLRYALEMAETAEALREDELRQLQDTLGDNATI